MPRLSALESRAVSAPFAATPRVALKASVELPRALPLPRHRHVRRSQRGTVTVNSTTELDAPVNATKHAKQFNWFKNWWPVQFTSNLDTDRPNRIQLLGEYFAVWKSKNGEWVAMRDVCPHRLAPLSEGAPLWVIPLLDGRVEEDGTLMCSYHGWRFNEHGSCVKIPQADSERSLKTACNNPRSVARTYPCKDRGGMLWIWPDASLTAFIDSAAIGIALPEMLADYLETKERIGRGSTRVVPYDFEVLMENILDPSHVPFAHHGVIPAMNRARGKPLHMKAVLPVLPLSMASVEYQGHNEAPAKLDRVGACLGLYQYYVPDPQKSPAYTVNLMCPVAEGKARILLSIINPGDLSGHNKNSPIEFVMRRFPFVFHLANNAVLDGDNVFLNMQGAHIRQELGGWNQKAFFTPTASDYMVMNFRRWLADEAGGGPFGPIARQRMNEISRSELLDRYDSHTAQCKECQKALRFFNNLTSTVRWFSYCSLAFGAWLIVRATQQVAVKPWQAVLTVVALVVFSSLERFLKEKVIPLFYYVNHVHAEKN